MFKVTINLRSGARETFYVDDVSQQYDVGGNLSSVNFQKARREPDSHFFHAIHLRLDQIDMLIGEPVDAEGKPLPAELAPVVEDANGKRKRTPKKKRETKRRK